MFMASLIQVAQDSRVAFSLFGRTLLQGVKSVACFFHVLSGIMGVVLYSSPSQSYVHISCGRYALYKTTTL